MKEQNSSSTPIPTPLNTSSNNIGGNTTTNKEKIIFIFTFIFIIITTIDNSTLSTTPSPSPKLPTLESVVTAKPFVKIHCRLESEISKKIPYNIDNVVYIHSNICSNGNDDILQEIYLTGNLDYSYINWSNNAIEAYSKRLTSTNQNGFTFSLTDGDGEIINLNGIDLNITLCFFKKEVYYDMHKDFMKYIAHKDNESVMPLTTI
ncbi:hypothetical protein ACTFIT_008971 [Dictyostelium discoideum]